MNTIRSWYDNIGGKIKSLAMWIFIIEAATTIIAGVSLFLLAMAGGGPGPVSLLLILTIPVVIVFEFMSSWLLYAFGELVEKTQEIARNTRRVETKSETQSNS